MEKSMVILELTKMQQLFTAISSVLESPIGVVTSLVVYSTHSSNACAISTDDQHLSALKLLESESIRLVAFCKENFIQYHKHFTPNIFKIIEIYSTSPLSSVTISVNNLECTPTYRAKVFLDFVLSLIEDVKHDEYVLCNDNIPF